MIIKKVLLLIAIWCSFTIEGLSSQERISGSSLVDLVIQRLSEQGISAQPYIKKNRVFTGCSSDKIMISKRDKSWKTVKLTCRDNSSWRYIFRNKVTGSLEKEALNVAQNSLKKIKSQNTQAVFVLTKPKLKGERIDEADLILAYKNKLLSRGAFEDLKLVIGKRLKKSLQKGSILKAVHLNPNWLVHKNQRIMIENNNGGIFVAMEGIALSNGAKGDRILAKNISSNKTIEGFVKSEKKISIFRKIY
tara:strand:+ start:59 stop:802 length:744 start_codon:yes stop_codon:yes gene_type:complete